MTLLAQRHDVEVVAALTHPRPFSAVVDLGPGLLLPAYLLAKDAGERGDDAVIGAGGWGLALHACFPSSVSQPARTLTP